MGAVEGMLESVLLSSPLPLRVLLVPASLCACDYSLKFEIPVVYFVEDSQMVTDGKNGKHYGPYV
jgi:hypothetical protein